LRSNKINKGLCYSNFKKRKSVVVITETSNPNQFVNSALHEIRHLERHIEYRCGIDPYSEEAAYLAGSIGELMFPKAKWFVCNCYRKNEDK